MLFAWKSQSQSNANLYELHMMVFLRWHFNKLFLRYLMWNRCTREWHMWYYQKHNIFTFTVTQTSLSSMHIDNSNNRYKTNCTGLRLSAPYLSAINSINIQVYSISAFYLFSYSAYISSIPTLTIIIFNLLLLLQHTHNAQIQVSSNFNWNSVYIFFHCWSVHIVFYSCSLNNDHFSGM